MSAVMEGTVALPDGGHLAYDLAGEGPMLTMIHPGLWDRRTWDREFDAWADRYRVLRYDVRGYGRSSRLTGAPYSHARDLAVLLETRGHRADEHRGVLDGWGDRRRLRVGGTGPRS